MFDESHLSISCCQTPENKQFGSTKILQMTNGFTTNGVLKKAHASTLWKDNRNRLPLPEGSVVAIVSVFSLLTLVLSRTVSHTQTTQVLGKPGLVGSWHTALLEEVSHS